MRSAEERRVAASFAAGLAGAMAAGLLGVGLLTRPASRVLAGPDADEAEHALPPARHEQRDIHFLPFAIAGVLVAVALSGALGLAAWLYPGASRNQVLTLPLPLFPSPQLQTSPADDMAAFRAAQLRTLNGVAWIDQARGVVHMPIEDAMRALAREGIADWPTTARVQR